MSAESELQSVQEPASPGVAGHAMSRRATLLLLPAAAVLALLPFVILAAYAFPSADDYCLAIQSRGRFWAMQIDHYRLWTGRYAASLLQAIATQGDMARLYPAVAYATLAATLLSFWALLATLPACAAKRLPRLLAAAVAMAVFIGGLPSLVEAFYWMASAVTYQWGLATYLVWLALIVRLTRPVSIRIARVTLQALAVVLTALVPGFNEVTIPIVLATLGAVIVFARSEGRKVDRFALVLLGVALACSAAALLAHGNVVRSASYPASATRHNLEFALLETARQTVRFFRDHSAYAALWVAAIAAWWWGRDVVLSLVRAVGGVRAAWIVLAGLCALVYGTLFPLYWEYGATNYTGEGRTYNVTYFVFCAAVVWGTSVALVSLPHRWAATLLRWRTRPGASLLVAGALAAAIVAAPAITPAYRALETAPEYLDAQQMREAVMRAAAARGEAALVPVLSVTPAGLYWGDINTDPGHWINSCVAGYYGLTAVRSYRPDD